MDGWKIFLSSLFLEINCGLRALGEPRRSALSTMVLSFIEPKLIFFCSRWRAWSAILRVIARLLGFDYVLYLRALKCFVVGIFNTGWLLVISTCMFAWWKSIRLARTHSKICKRIRVFNIECNLDFYWPTKYQNVKLNRFFLPTTSQGQYPLENKWLSRVSITIILWSFSSMACNFMTFVGVKSNGLSITIVANNWAWCWAICQFHDRWRSLINV